MVTFQLIFASAMYWEDLTVAQYNEMSGARRKYIIYGCIPAARVLQVTRPLFLVWVWLRESNGQ